MEEKKDETTFVLIRKKDGQPLSTVGAWILVTFIQVLLVGWAGLSFYVISNGIKEEGNIWLVLTSAYLFCLMIAVVNVQLFGGSFFDQPKMQKTTRQLAIRTGIVLLITVADALLYTAFAYLAYGRLELSDIGFGINLGICMVGIGLLAAGCTMVGMFLWNHYQETHGGADRKNIGGVFIGVLVTVGFFFNDIFRFLFGSLDHLADLIAKNLTPVYLLTVIVVKKQTISCVMVLLFGIILVSAVYLLGHWRYGGKEI